MLPRILAGLGAVICLAHPVKAEERYYSLTIEGKRVGYSHYRVEQTPEGRKTTSSTVIKVSFLGTSSDISYEAVSLYSADGRRPLRHAVDFRSGATSTTVKCQWTGGKVKVESTVAGATQTKTLEWGADSYLVEGNSIDTWNALFAAVRSGITQRELRLFYPLGAAESKTKIRRARPTVVSSGGRRIVCDIFTTGDGLQAAEFVVPRGTWQIIEFRVPGQKAVFRLADSSAIRDVRSYDPTMRAFSLTDAPLPAPAKWTYLKARVKAEIVAERVVAANLMLPTQTFSGKASGSTIDGVFDVRAYQYEPRDFTPFSWAAPADPKLARYLKREEKIECDDPDIVALAKRLTQGAQTNWDAVQRIGRWVHENIAYRITGSGAKQCLATKTGDCGPHTMLTVALCRAAGIPARVTGGVLYSHALGGSFGQHYWTRVWMGKDAWVPIDTTSGEIGTLSPGHLTLWNLGGLASLSVKVLDYSPKAAATSTSPAAARTPVRFTVGARERWVFMQDGKEIGEQTAECTGIEERTGGKVGSWRYSSHITADVQGASVTVSTDGTFVTTDLALPVALAMNASTAETKTHTDMRFEGRKVLVTMKFGDQEIKRDAALEGDEVLQVNNTITVMGIVTQSLRLQPGQSRVVPCFATAGLQRLDLTFAALPKTETITVGGSAVECVVSDVAPIANRFYTRRDTGELIRVTADAQKLVIDRK